jgi:WXG100 family type VII secretion target
MSQAIVDPDELRRFARNLHAFNTELQERTSALGNQLASLGTTWRDQEHEKFVEEFQQHMRAITRFIEAGNEHIPYLLRKAERIDEYLQQR